MTKVETQGITPSKESQDDDVEVNGNEDDVHEIEEGETDKKSKHHTPLKARWIFRLINEVIEKTPNLSNREMKNILMDYVKSNFMMTSLLQNVRTFARSEAFGDPSKNVCFLNGLIETMKKGGHEVLAVVKSRAELMKMLEHVVLSEQMMKNKAAGKLMSKVLKVAYVMKWKKKNKLIMLVEGGVWPPEGGNATVVTPLKFLSGIMFATSNA